MATTLLTVRERNQKSKDNEDRSWPFLCVSINFTKECLQQLRNGVFNDKCNKLQSVMNVLHDYHKALFAEFMR